MADPITVTGIAASAAGATIAAVKQADVSRSVRFVNGLSGFACSYFITPLAADYLHMTNERAAYGLAFVVGLFGVAIMSAAMSIDWRSVITKKVGGDK